MAENLTKPFNLYSKQQPREVNSSIVESNGLNFNDHPSYQINMDNDAEPNTFSGRKGAHGFLKITNNASGYEFVTDGITNAKSVGANDLASSATIALSMTSNDEFFLISVYFYDTNKPALTISPLAGN